MASGLRSAERPGSKRPRTRKPWRALFNTSRRSPGTSWPVAWSRSTASRARRVLASGSVFRTANAAEVRLSTVAARAWLRALRLRSRATRLNAVVATTASSSTPTSARSLRTARRSVVASRSTLVASVASSASLRRRLASISSRSVAARASPEVAAHVSIWASRLPVRRKPLSRSELIHSSVAVASRR